MTAPPSTSRATPSAVGTPWRRLGLFSLLPLLSAISPLAILPIIARTTGPDGWAAVAIGQSTGVASISFVEVGWMIRGPSLLAGLDGAAQRRLLTASVYARLVSGVPTAIAVSVACVLLAPDGFAPECAVVGLASCVSALVPTWYFIGLGKPRKIAVYDTLPRVLATLAAVPLVLLTRSALPFGGILLAVTVVAIVVSQVREGGPGTAEHPVRPAVVESLRTGWPLGVSGLIMSGYTSMAVPVFTLAVGGAVALVASFASGIRVMNMAQGALRACTNSLQGWVTEDLDAAATRRRMRAALRSNVLLGLVAGTFLATCLPVLCHVVFGSRIGVSPLTAVFVGTALFLNATSASLNYHILAPTGKLRTIAVSLTLASLVGVVLIVGLAGRHGVEGAAAAVLIAELLVFAVQLPPAVRSLRGRPALLGSSRRVGRIVRGTLVTRPTQIQEGSGR